LEFVPPLSSRRAPKHAPSPDLLFRHPRLPSASGATSTAAGSRGTFPSAQISTRRRQRSVLGLLKPLPAGEKGEGFTLPVASVHLVRASSFLASKKIAACHPVGHDTRALVAAGREIHHLGCANFCAESLPRPYPEGTPVPDFRFRHGGTGEARAPSASILRAPDPQMFGKRGGKKTPKKRELFSNQSKII
jgi:hypothetical protein